MTPPIGLYNTRTRAVDEFVPPKGRPVWVYVCGITPYDTTHMGHAATYAAFDVLVRFLEYRGHAVRYVENVTDIDDDILRKAAQVDDDWRRLGNRWTAHFINDMIALRMRPPDEYVRATETIPDIVVAVQRLLDAGVAYAAEGNVYFEVARDPDFGQLSRLAPEARLAVANERGNRPDDPHKRDPLDFVLWQAAAPGEPTWDSPWGSGRPGWHIECSTMIQKWLGPQIDIHGGGGDLAFPHHECEIAQAECAGTPQPFVRIWMHTGMVRYQGEKMSKSLGNLVMARDVLQRFSADALRTYLGEHHYRGEWEFEWGGLDAAAGLAGRLAHAAQVTGSGTTRPLDASESVAEFDAALADDLDTPRALRTLDALAGRIEAQAGVADVRPAQKKLATLAGVLGLTCGGLHPEPRVLRGWERHLARFQAGA